MSLSIEANFGFFDVIRKPYSVSYIPSIFCILYPSHPPPREIILAYQVFYWDSDGTFRCEDDIRVSLHVYADLLSFVNSRPIDDVLVKSLVQGGIGTRESLSYYRGYYCVCINMGHIYA